MLHTRNPDPILNMQNVMLKYINLNIAKSLISVTPPTGATISNIILSDVTITKSYTVD